MALKRKTMLNRRVCRFLQKPRVVRLATVGADGYPHVVPIWFRRDGNDLVFGSDRDNRKVRNILANPKGAVVVAGELPKDNEGYMIQGNLSVTDDVNHASMRKLPLRYETKQDAKRLAIEWAEGDLVLIRLKPKKVIRVY